MPGWVRVTLWNQNENPENENSFIATSPFLALQDPCNISCTCTRFLTPLSPAATARSRLPLDRENYRCTHHPFSIHLRYQPETATGSGKRTTVCFWYSLCFYNDCQSISRNSFRRFYLIKVNDVPMNLAISLFIGLLFPYFIAATILKTNTGKNIKTMLQCVTI